jgi:hypothetical protein
MMRTATFALMAVLLVGCYTLRPTRGVSPEVGTPVAFDVNDVGRVALGGYMGPSISQIEGRLLETNNGEYVVAVSSVKLLNGGQQIWSGERVSLKKEHLAYAYERRFSPKRTAAATAVTVGGIAVFLITRNLIVSGGRTDGSPPGEEPNALRVRP